MTTTPQDSLAKIRRQIASTEKYLAENPDWPGTISVLDLLVECEKMLEKLIQVEYMRQRQGIEGMKNEVR